MSSSSQNSSIYANSLFGKELPKKRIPEQSLDPKTAYRLIHDELATQGNPMLNMASFVTTVMDEECDRLIAENLGVNYIDTEVYRANSDIQSRCVNMLNDLCNAPDIDKSWGTECVGSSEAVMLAMLSHKRAWQEKRKAAGKPFDKPNIVMGNDVHLVWNKGSIYFEIEQRLIPLCPNKYTITAEEVVSRVDENTICVVGVLGTSYTFQYDPIEEINNALVNLKKNSGLDVPLHVDGASGVFIAPFLNPEIKWDFRLEQVKTINVSGHKYGLVYPGIGWALWRDESDIPESLITETNVLGFLEKSFSLNFSRGGAMILAQYYNFIRLGKEGYKEVQNTMRENARYLASRISELSRFNIINDGTYTPSCCICLKDESKFNGSDLVHKLAEKGWIIPAFSMPANAQSVNAIRMNIKETFSRDMADILVSDIKIALDNLDSIYSSPHHKVGTHHH
ncbi:glutamate decarboxylase [Synechococcus sp. AH-551-G15]|nr:glutamate decarboxylase [Synechococcus sp. AH-551-G15]